MLSRSARVVLIGNPKVGKTSLVKSLFDDKVDPKYEPTIGAAFFTFSVMKSGETMSMQIWDTAGQEKYKSLGPVYYRNSVGAIVVYDICNSESFYDLQAWVDAFLDVTGNNSQIFIVANKSDLSSDSEVLQAGEKWAIDHDYKFYVTSAKTGSNVRYMFESVLELSTIANLPPEVPTPDPGNAEPKCSC